MTTERKDFAEDFYALALSLDVLPVTCTDFFSHSMHWEDIEGCVEAVTIYIVPTFDDFPGTK